MSSVSHSVDLKTATTTGRLWAAGLLAVLLSVALNTFIGVVAVHMYGISTEEFVQLQWWRYTLFTIIPVIAATVLYGWLVRRKHSRQPVRTFIIISLIVLIVSFVPHFFMLSAEDALVPGILALSVMHVVPATVCMIAIPEWSH